MSKIKTLDDVQETLECLQIVIPKESCFHDPAFRTLCMLFDNLKRENKALQDEVTRLSKELDKRTEDDGEII